MGVANVDYPIDNIPGFEGRKIVLRPAGVLTGVKLFVDGEAAKPKWGKFTLRRNDGTETQAILRSNFVDPIPQLMVDGKVYSAVKPLAWYELVWSGLPILLLFIGGALGAFCGLVAAYTNSRIFRTGLHPVLKYLVTGAVSLVALVVWFILAMLVTAALQG
jgi:hypothetical protein